MSKINVNIKKISFALVFIVCVISFSCTSLSKLSSKGAKDKILKEKDLANKKEQLKIDSEVKLNELKEGFAKFKNERVAIINIHDFPDSALISAKAKMNPPDLAIDQARNIQKERAELLRQALVTYCDTCDHIEILNPIDVFGENQLNFYFDKIFLRQEVLDSDFSMIRKDLAKYSVVILLLSSESYEKNRGINRNNEIVAETEAEVKMDVYAYHFNDEKRIYRSLVTLKNRDYLFYKKIDGGFKGQAPVLSNVEDKQIKRVLNDSSFDDIYPYPLSDESLTFFYYLYNEVLKNLSGE